MQPFTTPNKIVITCHKWLSPALATEVISLGFNIDRSFQTGVEITGTINDCIRLNLNLRTASQVLYSIKTFNCSIKFFYDDLGYFYYILYAIP